MITKLILPNTDFDKLCEEKEKEREVLSKTKEYKKARECYDWLWIRSMPDDINIEQIQTCIIIFFAPMLTSILISNIPDITFKIDFKDSSIFSIITILMIIGLIQALLYFVIRHFKERKYKKIVVDYCESIGKIDTPVDEVFGYRKPIIPYKNVAELLLKWSLVAGASYATKREEDSKTVTVYLCTNNGNDIIDSFCIEPKRHMSELFSKVDEGCLDFTFIDSLIQEEEE